MRSRCCTQIGTGPDEKAAFKAQVEALGVGTTLLVDTYDITQGVANAVDVAGPDLGAVRIDSGDLGVLARQVREQLDSLGARNTRIVVSGDLDEFAIAALRAEPVDIYGVGTSVVTGSGAPTADGLQAGGGGRGTGGEAQPPQGVARRPQAGGAPGQVDRHHRRGGRPSVGASRLRRRASSNAR